jgi:hypothetical protein
MEPNSRFNGVLVHPVDLFPRGMNQFDNLNKMDLKTANIDGYNAHPVDLFVSNNNNNSNLNRNFISNIPNLNNTQQNNNLGLMPNQQNMGVGGAANAYNQKINIRDSYEPQIQSNPFISPILPINKNQAPSNSININPIHNQLNNIPTPTPFMTPIPSLKNKNEASFVNYPGVERQKNNSIIINNQDNNQNINYIQQPALNNNNLFNLQSPKPNVINIDNYNTNIDYINNINNISNIGKINNINNINNIGSFNNISNLNNINSINNIGNINNISNLNNNISDVGNIKRYENQIININKNNALIDRNSPRYNSISLPNRSYSTLDNTVSYVEPPLQSFYDLYKNNINNNQIVSNEIQPKNYVSLLNDSIINNSNAQNKIKNLLPNQVQNQIEIKSQIPYQIPNQMQNQIEIQNQIQNQIIPNQIQNQIDIQNQIPYQLPNQMQNQIEVQNQITYQLPDQMKNQIEIQNQIPYQLPNQIQNQIEIQNQIPIINQENQIPIQIPNINQGINTINASPYIEQKKVIDNINNINMINYINQPSQIQEQQFNAVQSNIKDISLYPIVRLSRTRNETNYNNPYISAIPSLPTTNINNNNIQEPISPLLNINKIPQNNFMKPPSYSTGTYEPEAQIGENATRLDVIKQYLDPTSPKMNIQTENYNIPNPNPKYPMDTIETVSTMATTLFVPNQSTVVSPRSNTIVIPNQKTVIVPPSQQTVIVPTQNTIVVPKPNPLVMPSQKTIVVPTQRSIIIPSSRTVVVPTQNSIISPTVNTPAISNKPIQSIMNTNAYNPSKVINLPSTSTVIPSVSPTLINMPTTLRSTPYNAYKPRPLSNINNANRFFPRKIDNSYDNLNLSRNRRTASRTPIKYNISTFIPRQRRTTSQINNNLKVVNNLYRSGY